jgi:hypothetical protein
VLRSDERCHGYLRNPFADFPVLRTNGTNWFLGITTAFWHDFSFDAFFATDRKLSEIETNLEQAAADSLGIE